METFSLRSGVNLQNVHESYAVGTSRRSHLSNGAGVIAWVPFVAKYACWKFYATEIVGNSIVCVYACWKSYGMETISTGGVCVLGIPWGGNDLKLQIVSQ